MPTFESASQFLQSLSTSVDPKKIAGLNTIVLFDLAGEGGGQWTATIASGQLQVADGKTATPNATFKMKAADFVAIVNGTLNPVAAFMQGRVRVEGDMSVAMRLQTLFT